MERTHPSSTWSHSDQDINYLVSFIIRNVSRDITEKPQILGIAQYMLHSRKFTLQKCIKLFSSPNASKYLKKLLDSESEFMGMTPRPIGIDIVSNTMSNKIQQTLDVKHVLQKKKTNQVSSTIIAAAMNVPYATNSAVVREKRAQNKITAEDKILNVKKNAAGEQVPRNKRENCGKYYDRDNGEDDNDDGSVNNCNDHDDDNDEDDDDDDEESIGDEPLSRAEILRYENALKYSARYIDSRAACGTLKDVRTLLDRMNPQIKSGLLHTNEDFLWIRYHTFNKRFRLPDRIYLPIEDLDTMTTTTTTNKVYQYNIENEENVESFMKRNQPYLIIQFKRITHRVSSDVYETYLEHKCLKTYTATVSASVVLLVVSSLVRFIEKKLKGSVIFCSELRLFHYNPLLFLSNYVKFLYCYTLNRDIFDPVSYEEVEKLSMYLTNGFLFLKTGNMTSMPVDTHGPLVAYTGERPQSMLSKFNPSSVYVNEGTRAMQSMDKSSDIGATSNFVEIITKININDDVLKDIV